jgi:hypothetical protein
VPERPPVLGRLPVLDGNSAVGALAVLIKLVYAQALESPVKNSVTPSTYRMPHQVFEMQYQPHCAGKCHDELRCEETDSFVGLDCQHPLNISVIM